MSKKQHLSYHVSLFSDKVRALNQANSKTLTMSADDARNLQSDIFALLAKIAELSVKPVHEEAMEVKLDGGQF
jgi:hypothetical protein